ncbi:hypothetical protein SLE2022_207630 [Rubroshorea leprosula]
MRAYCSPKEISASSPWPLCQCNRTTLKGQSQITVKAEVIQLFHHATSAFEFKKVGSQREEFKTRMVELEGWD